MMRTALCLLLGVLLVACAQRADSGGGPTPEAAALAEAGRLRMLFDRGSIELSGVAKEEIGALSALMRRQPELNVVMAGFAGTSRDNEIATQRIALARLLTVRARLVGSGISESRIHLRACGFRGDVRAPDRIEAYVVAERDRARNAKPCGPPPSSGGHGPITIGI